MVKNRFYTKHRDQSHKLGLVIFKFNLIEALGIRSRIRKVRRSRNQNYQNWIILQIRNRIVGTEN